MKPKTELMWPGKYDESGKRVRPDPIRLPFQVIETANKSRTAHESGDKPRQISLFDTYEGKEGDTFDSGWRNKLIWGDNKLVMGSLLKKFEGEIDLIYIDPPFNTGDNFSFKTQIGETDWGFWKEPSIIEKKVFDDTWRGGVDTYIRMMYERLDLIHDLLSDTGSLFVHCDWTVNFLLRAILDEIFGEGNHVNEIVWYYYNKFQGNIGHFASNHDVIFWYRRGSNHKFHPQKEDREKPVKQLKRTWDKRTGRIVNVKGASGKVLYRVTDKRAVDDVWRIPMLQPADTTQNTGFPTQKPEKLLEMIIDATTDPGDLVADFFCGSGTTLRVAEKKQLRWIGCDLSRWAIHTSRKSLLEIENCKPFEVLNLGKYERKYWQTTTFGDRKESDQQIAVFQYVAFILKLYGAQPLAGMQFLHGKKGRSVIHVGAVDAPVTIDETISSLDECQAVKQSELHILGWEWEMGLNELVVAEAQRRGIKLVLLSIPREVMDPQAIEKGDVQFFELAYLDLQLRKDKTRSASIELKDFVIQNMDLIPEDVRPKLKAWSDYVDYWAVDWDFRNDTFMNGWVAYRTRKDRTLPLKSNSHPYDKPGEYTIMVKVVDIFGNDTTKPLSLEVR